MDKIAAQELMMVADELATIAMKTKGYKGLDDKTTAKYYTAYRSDFVSILLAQATMADVPVATTDIAEPVKTSKVVRNAK